MYKRQSLNRLLSHVGIEEALQLEQVEEILRQEESKLVAATSTNEERLLRLNSFGYPLLAEEMCIRDRLYLKSLRDGEWVKLDSAEVVHGLFSMKGKIDSVQMVTLYMDRCV